MIFVLTIIFTAAGAVLGLFWQKREIEKSTSTFVQQYIEKKHIQDYMKKKYEGE